MNNKPYETKDRCEKCDKVLMSAYPLSKAIVECRGCGHIQIIHPKKTIPLRVKEPNKTVA